LKDFILINILIKIHTSTLCLDFILIKIHLSALSGGHAGVTGATTSPAEDSEAALVVPPSSRVLRSHARLYSPPCVPCQVRGGTCGGTAFDSF
jgi:hypothetical protein